MEVSSLYKIAVFLFCPHILRSVGPSLDAQAAFPTSFHKPTSLTNFAILHVDRHTGTMWKDMFNIFDGSTTVVTPQGIFMAKAVEILVQRAVRLSKWAS